MTDLFISYSRRDKAFVQRLHQALMAYQFDVWVDWEDIPLTADWWQEIKAGIEAADNFLFVISPDSVASKVCGQEIDHAAENQKRLVPIMFRDGFNHDQVRPVIGKHNWLFFRETDNFDASVQALVNALNTDLEYVKFHTRLLVRAQEWEKKGRRNDYLLRGKDLEESTTWLEGASLKEPQPTDLQRAYIRQSRQAELMRQRQEKRRLQIFAGVVSALAISAIAAAILAVMKRQEAIAQREIAYQQSKIAFAHQLAVEADQDVQGQILSLKDMRLEVKETILAFGLAALPPEVAERLAAENPRLISFSPSRTFIVIITADYALRAWNLNTGEVVLDTKSDSRTVDVGFSPDETLVTAANENGTLRIWRVNPQKYELAGSLRAHEAGLTDTAFSPDGKYLVTASWDGTARIWDLDNILVLKGQQSGILYHPAAVTAVTFSPDGQHILTGSEDAFLRVWSRDAKVVLCIAHQNPISLLRFDVDGSNVGSVSGDTLVRIWPWANLLNRPSEFADTRSGC